MSYYYSYYIGMKKDGMIFPLGPFGPDGKIRSAICKSRSCASDLHELFTSVPESMISQELRSEFEVVWWNGEKLCEVRWLPLAELPTSFFIKSGYYLIDDIRRVESAEDEWGMDDIFYEMLEPAVYAAMVQSELKFGKPAPKKDVEGNDIPAHSVNEYMYYAIPDYSSREYEAFLLRQFVESLASASETGVEIVILETEG